MRNQISSRSIQIIIPGVPIAQGRIRLSKKNSKYHGYDPQSSQKKLIKAKIYLQTKHIKEHFKHPEVSFIFYMPIVGKVKKKERHLYESGVIRHEKKPDVDNLCKCYLDCLDGFLFIGDQQVSIGSAIKLYHAEPKTIITVIEKNRFIDNMPAGFLPPFEEFDKSNTIEKDFQRGYKSSLVVKNLVFHDTRNR